MSEIQRYNIVTGVSREDIEPLNKPIAQRVILRMQSVYVTVFNVETRYPDLNFVWCLSFTSDILTHVLPQIPRLFLFALVLSH